MQNNRVLLYVFDLNDGRDTDERLQLAAERYRADHAELFGSVVDKSSFLVARTKRGKPYFPRCPRLNVSVSHSGAYWVCALSQEAVGVDLQEHVRMEGESVGEASIRFCKMAHRFFHPVEAEFVNEDSYLRFFGVWAARESYVKYTGQGIDATFSEHCVIPEKREEQPEMNQESGARAWHAEGVSFWEMIFQEDYTLCVCTKEASEIIFAK